MTKQLKLYVKYIDLKESFELLEGEYKLLDRDKVEFLSLLDENKNSVYSVYIGKDSNFAYRRRYRMREGAKDTCHIICKFTKQGKKIAFVFEDTHQAVIKDSFDENHGWFYSPIFTQEELEI